MKEKKKEGRLEGERGRTRSPPFPPHFPGVQLNLLPPYCRALLSERLEQAISLLISILGDPGEKYGTKKSKERRGFSRRSLLLFVPYFSARLDFPSPPLSAPGSPRMTGLLIYRQKARLSYFTVINTVI